MKNSKMNNTINSYIKASFFTFLTSLCCIMSDILMRSITLVSFDIIFLRFLFSTCILMCFNKNLNFLNKDNALRAIIFGISINFFILGLKQMKFGLVILINFSTPIWIILMSYFILKEKMNHRLISSLFAILGIFIALFDEIKLNSILPILYLILASIGFASLDIINKFSLNKKQNIFEILLGSAFFCTLFHLPFFSFTIPNFSNIYLIFFLAIVSNSILYFSLKANALAELSSIQTIKYLEFPISILVGIYLFHEKYSANIYIGFFFLILGIIINYKKELSN